MIKPVIVAVGYNRPDCMKRLLESVGNASYDCNDITLVVSIDESNKSDDVEKVACEFEWKHGEKIIRRFPERQGLKKHIIACGDLSQKYGAVIILEDDLYVSPVFYKYVQTAHEYYKDNDKIAGVSLYSNAVSLFNNYKFIPEKGKYDNYFGQYIVTWGESWTAKQWEKYKAWFLEHDDKLPAVNDKMPAEISSWTRSWGKFFVSFMVENDLYYVVPYTALSTNFSEQGEHRPNEGYDTRYQVCLQAQDMDYRFAPFDEGIKYDCFFERMLDKNVEIEGISASDICFDLQGTRISPLGKKYLLTCKTYGLPLVKTFALRMRPIEVNVLNNLSGDGINLYKIDRDIELITRKTKRNYIYEYNAERIAYESYELNRRQINPYYRKQIKDLIKRKLNRRKK